MLRRLDRGFGPSDRVGILDHKAKPFVYDVKRTSKTTGDRSAVQNALLPRVDTDIVDLSREEEGKLRSNRAT